MRLRDGFLSDVDVDNGLACVTPRPGDNVGLCVRDNTRTQLLNQRYDMTLPDPWLIALTAECRACSSAVTSWSASRSSSATRCFSSYVRSSTLIDRSSTCAMSRASISTLWT